MGIGNWQPIFTRLICLPPFYCSMARKVTAGHQSLRQSEHSTVDYTKTHDIVAVSPEGEHLWVTDSCYERETVAPEVKLADEYSGITDVVIDGQQVSHFELVEA